MAALSRRGVLGAAAVLPLAAVPAMAATVPGDDAELLQLSAEFQRHQRRDNELNAAYGDVVHIPDEVTEERKRIAPIMHDLAERMAELRATTSDGLRAKAAAMLFYTGWTWEGDPLWDNHNELLGWSIGRDLCGDAAARPAA